MLKIEIICLFSLKDKSLHKLALEYQNRLKPLAKVDIVELKPAKFSEAKDSQLKAQSKDEAKLMSYVGKRNILLLSQEGSLYDSIELANLFNQYDGQLLSLIIGNTLGFSESFKKKFKLLSLSPLTLPHQLAMVVLLEQIYRSSCILTGKQYHF